MKVLRLLSIVVICSAKKSNGLGVMQETMELGNLEVPPDSKLDKNVLILVKSAQRIIHRFEAFCAVHCILSKIEKIKERPQKTGQASGRLDIRKYICHNSKKDTSYVFVFLTSDLVILENHVKLL